MRDIYGGDYARFGLPGDLVASRLSLVACGRCVAASVSAAVVVVAGGGGGLNEALFYGAAARGLLQR